MDPVTMSDGARSSTATDRLPFVARLSPALLPAVPTMSEAVNRLVAERNGAARSDLGSAMQEVRDLIVSKNAERDHIKFYRFFKRYKLQCDIDHLSSALAQAQRVFADPLSTAETYNERMSAIQDAVSNVTYESRRQALL